MIHRSASKAALTALLIPITLAPTAQALEVSVNSPWGTPYTFVGSSRPDSTEYTIDSNLSSARVDAAIDLPSNPVILKSPVAHDGAPQPSAFPTERILRWYESDIAPGGLLYFNVVDGFADLKAHHPEILQENLRKTIEINNNASPEQIARALNDDHDDRLWTMTDAYGSVLGQHFRDALKENRLPKTSQLLAGTLARGGGIANSSAAEKYWFNNDRPFVVAPNDIKRYHRGWEGDDDEYSTTPSYPSGHTNQAAWKATLLAYMLPEFGPQIIARASEVGYNRVVVGVHYPLDVIGGMSMGMAAAADRLLDPEFKSLIDEAATELRTELEWRCGGSLKDCQGTPYMSDEQAVQTVADRMTYGFDKIYDDTDFIVPADAAALGDPAVIKATALPGGYPLDKPGKESWQRINLAAVYAQR